MVPRLGGVCGRVMVITMLCSALVGAETTVAQVQGQPKFSDGKALGYFVWKDGDTWKVRWMTFGSVHRFSGRIQVEGGEIRSLKRVDVDTERKIMAPGRPGHVVLGPRGRVIGRTGGRPAIVASREEDKIEQETEHLIRFLTRTTNDVDGLDFKVTDSSERLRFALQIDDKPRPEEVEVGKNNVKPNEHPLVVRLR
ncbi:MAG TPA: hypothetical protein VL914_00820 [Vicinamibacterales bacterium]|nr:hypothetical protein [Vicinamibacterales bacterium]